MSEKKMEQINSTGDSGAKQVFPGEPSPDKLPIKMPEYDGIRLPPFPPLFKDAGGRLNQIKNFNSRPDDIILAAYPRSGTHWLWEILFMLINGKAEYTKEVKETAFLEHVDSFDQLDGKASPRVLNTHVPYRWLPQQHLQNGGKIVHVARNPKDVLVSMFHFMRKMERNAKEVPWSIFFNQMMNNQVQLYGGWFAYEKEIEEANYGHMINLRYEEMKRNPAVEIKRLADFLELDVSSDLIQEIIEKCSFNNLKAADATIKDTAPADNKSGHHYRKGESGDWKNQFTVAQNEQFDEMFKKEMKNSKLKIQFE